MPFLSKSEKVLNKTLERFGLGNIKRDDLSTRLLDAVYPPRCGGCSRLGEEVFCYHCQLHIHPIKSPFCQICGVPFDPLAKTNEICNKCRLKTPHYDAARCHQRFEGPMREAIHQLKYKRQFDYARRLAPLLLEVLNHDEKLRDFESEFLVPVPLYKSRLRTRGFNQSAKLAEELYKLSGIPVSEVLIRTRKTPPQVGLSREDRLKNVRGAFEIQISENDKKPLDSKNQAVQGSRIILIDDVFTTGATLDECARILKKAGAGEVCALTLARQRSPQDNEPIYEHWVETIV